MATGTLLAGGLRLLEEIERLLRSAARHLWEQGAGRQ